MQLTHKVAIITGAAEGMGRALALELADRGCHLAICDVDDEGLRETAAFANGRGVHVSVLACDVARLDQVQAFVEQSLRRHSHADILINAAGVGLARGLEAASCEELRSVVDVNLWGVVHTCKALVGHLRTRPQAHIVNASGVHGLFDPPRQPACLTTRAAVCGFSRALRDELAGSRVLVSVPRPRHLPESLVRHAGFLAQNSVALAARRIVRAIERDEARIVLGLDAPVRELAARVMPWGGLGRKGANAG
jgi:NAD(P)-dependent dehydrogenase (short-subunit alcohol dehydrogenase family)